MSIEVVSLSIVCNAFQFIDDSSLGMIKTRVSGVGRRLILTSTIDEKEFPFASKPGFTFGVSTRIKPK